MKILTKKEIQNIVSNELKYWIYDGTQNMIAFFESRIEKMDFPFYKVDAFIKKIKICTDIAFAFAEESKSNSRAEVDWLFSELNNFKEFLLRQKEFSFENSPIMRNLETQIRRIKSKAYSENDFSTTDEDIMSLKKELEEQKKQDEQLKKESVEREQRQMQARKEKLEKWRSKNLNKNFDVRILDEIQLKILKEALKSEIKCISISWTQRRFMVGYAKAGSIIDFFEQNGIVPTFEEACELGVGKYGRIIRVSF